MGHLCREDAVMGDRTRGLYDKFFVSRTDGTSRVGGKHNKCRYFVLDLDHDPHAMPALAAYADACRETHPLLAADLDAITGAKDECTT